ncbi:MAG: T9SS type A sorting domain-containing protein [Flavobacteriales bacterium]|nr:T9SS type A sorting domain-containing protein [Flavobacteriales bacterium]
MKNQIFKAVIVLLIMSVSYINSKSQIPEWKLCHELGQAGYCTNLVVNPSFNNYNPGFLPTNGPANSVLDNIIKFCPWTPAVSVVMNGGYEFADNHHLGIPTGFSYVSLDAETGVPSNFYGTQEDEYNTDVCNEDDGDFNAYAYMGLYTYAQNIHNPQGNPQPAPDYREYAQQKLNAPLQNGITYSVTLRVSLVESSKKATPFGLLFTAQRPYFTPFGTQYSGVIPMPAGIAQPQITVPATTDKNNWVTYTFQYTHSGPDAQFLTIGNFDTDAQLTAGGNIQNVAASACNGCQQGDFSFYYIDDIAIHEATPRCCTFTPDPQLLCPYLQTYPAPVPVYNGTGCAGGVFQIQNGADYPQGTVFTWYFNGQTVGNGTSLNYTYPFGTQGSLTVTALPPYGCLTEADIQIPQCCVPAGYTGNNATTYVATGAPGSNKASDMLAHFGGTVPVNAQMAVNGLFTVDVNMHWDDVDVVFGENAKVVLNNNIHLSIEKSHLYACDKMWEGLEADHPSEKISLYKGSLLEHAYTGINSINGADIQVHNSTLNRNRNHIGIVFYSGTEHPARITANTFTCKNLSTGVLQTLPAPMQNEHTAFGITALAAGGLTVGRDVNFVLVGTPNKFEYADVHISAAYTGLEVKNAEFKLPLNWTPPSPLAGGILNITNGVAIYAYGPDGTASTQQLMVGGLGGEACTFNGSIPNPALPFFNNNMGAAIVSMNNIDVTVRNCGFTRLKYGVVVNKLTGWQSVSGNVVTQHGMNLLVNTSTFTDIDSCGVYGVVYNRAGVTVQQNTFTGMGHKGVYFGNVTSPSLFSGYLIQDNSIAGDRMTHGVHLINCSRAKVLANTVQFTAAPVGFYTMGSTTRYGIRTEGCSRLQIIDNQVRRTNTTISGVFSNTNYLRLQGINVAACPGATVCNNTLERLGTGMRFMLDNSGIRIRKNLMQSDHTGIDLFQAKVANPLVFSHDFLPTDNRWNNIVGGNTTRRLTGSSNQNTVWRWRSNNNADFNPNNHTVDPQIGTTFATFNGGNPSTLVTCFGEEVSSITEQNLEREALFGETVDNAETLSPEDSAALRLISEKQAFFYLANDSSLWATNLVEDDKFRDYVIEKEEELLGALKTVLDYELQGDKNSALARLQLIYPNGTAETFEKVVNEIYIIHWMKDTLSFDSTTMETLMLIANLTMEDGGSAVLGARVLLGGDAVDFESKMGDPLQEEENLEAMISVYPNPTYGYINFLTENMDLGFHFTMYTTEGVKVFDKYLNTPSPIEIFDISQGLYLYEIRTADMKKKTGKLVIMKN